MAEKSFEEVFGFEFNGGDFFSIESAIIIAKLRCFANQYKLAVDMLEKKMAKYFDNDGGISSEMALADLKVARELAQERDKAFDLWSEALRLASLNIKLRDTIESYY